MADPLGTPFGLSSVKPFIPTDGAAKPLTVDLGSTCMQTQLFCPKVRLCSVVFREAGH